MLRHVPRRRTRHEKIFQHVHDLKNKCLCYIKYTLGSVFRTLDTGAHIQAASLTQEVRCPQILAFAVCVILDTGFEVLTAFVTLCLLNTFNQGFSNIFTALCHLLIRSNSKNIKGLL